MNHPEASYLNSPSKSESKNITHSTENLANIDKLLNDPEVFSISIRRHGRYERGENVPHQRGQRTKETFPEVREAAKRWVHSLPANADINIVTSPTFMPAQGPSGEKIFPRRASVTGAIYGAELRERFGDGYGYLADEIISENNRELREHSSVEHKAERHHDRRIGDIFEMTTEEQSKFIPDFFRLLSEKYGGLNQQFWADFIHGELPKDLNDLYLKGGGETAVQKSAKAIDVITDMVDTPHEANKQIGLLVSHEEVIGSLVYQVALYAEDNGLLDAEALAQIKDKKYSYNEGFDVHVSKDYVATFVIEGQAISLNLKDFKNYLDKKIESAA